MENVLRLVGFEIYFQSSYFLGKKQQIKYLRIEKTTEQL